MLALCVAGGFPGLGRMAVSAQSVGSVRKMFSINPEHWGVPHPSAMAYSSSNGGSIFVMQAGDAAKIINITPYQELLGQQTLGSELASAIDDGTSQMLFDAAHNRLLFTLSGSSQLYQLSVDGEGAISTPEVTTVDLSTLGLSAIADLTLDQAGNLVLLDSSNVRIMRIAAEGYLNASEGTVSEGTVSEGTVSASQVTAIQLGAEQFAGHVLSKLAVHPVSQHLFVLSDDQKSLYELSEAGISLGVYDLSSLNLAEIRDLAFVPSADLTDDANTYHLLLIDHGIEAQKSETQKSETQKSETQKSESLNTQAANLPVAPEPEQSAAAFPALSEMSQSVYLPFASSDALSEAELEALGQLQEWVEQNSNAQSEEEKAMAAERAQGKILEVELVAGSDVQASALQTLNPLTTIYLARLTLTSLWSNPSPDPSGITYNTNNQQLYINDGEVDEMPLYAGVNLYQSAPNGSYNPGGSGNTQPLSNEPTDLAYNANTNTMFFSDDNQKTVFERATGPDGLHGTADDVLLRQFSTRPFNALDPEGITYDPINNRILICDGTNKEVYVVYPGNNGIFDGVASASPPGDDYVFNYDTGVLGIIDPEGIDYDTATGNIILTNDNPTYLHEVKTSGTQLVELRTFAIRVPSGAHVSGVAVAPASNGSERTYYLTDRAIDNNSNPSENDGKLYEFSLVPPTPLPPGGLQLYVTSAPGGTTSNGIAFADEDVVVDSMPTGITGSNNWMIEVDSSDIGITKDAINNKSVDLDAFQLLGDGSMLFSVDLDSVNIPGLGLIDNADIIKFIPAAGSHGLTTVGSYQWFFEGRDVGLTPTDVNADVDAITFAPDGRLLISTNGAVTLNGVAVGREDMIVLNNATGLGSNNVTGTWATYFDGSDVGLNPGTSGENIKAAWLETIGSTVKLYIATKGNYDTGTLTGDNNDIFVCTGTTTSFGDTTSCTWSAYWDGASRGYPFSIDGFSFKKF